MHRAIEGTDCKERYRVDDALYGQYLYIAAAVGHSKSKLPRGRQPGESDRVLMGDQCAVAASDRKGPNSCRIYTHKGYTAIAGAYHIYNQGMKGYGRVVYPAAAICHSDRIPLAPPGETKYPCMIGD